MEKFALLPFSAGCMSESSIAVGVQQAKKSKPQDSNLTSTREMEEEENLSGDSWKSPLALESFQKLLKNFKNFSQSFVYKDADEVGLEIGFPTDVKHVSHIGLDGCATSIRSEGWTINEGNQCSFFST